MSPRRDAGWYPSLTNPAKNEYWDGKKWTGWLSGDAVQANLTPRVPENRNWLARNIRVLGIVSAALLVVGLVAHGLIQEHAQDQRNQTALESLENNETSPIEESSSTPDDPGDFASFARGIDPSLVDVSDSDFASLSRGICDQLDLTDDVGQTALGVSDLGTLIGIQLSDYQWGQMVGASIKTVCPEHSDLLP